MIVRCGVDMVYLPRLERMLRKHGENFCRKILAPEEVDRVYSSPRARTQLQTFAGLFAAKEAIAKALGTGLWSAGVAWRDIVILKNSHGKPYIEFRNKVKEHADRVKIIGIDVSISHDGEYAIASCQMLIERDIIAFYQSRMSDE